MNSRYSVSPLKLIAVFASFMTANTIPKLPLNVRKMDILFWKSYSYVEAYAREYPLNINSKDNKQS